MQSVLIIVPTYNEKENVEGLSATIFRAVPAAHILFVDDHSPDGTGALLDQLTAQDERVHVLHRTDKQGLGRAYLAGFRWALEREYAYVVEMDADFSHNPEDVPRLVEALLDADLALGSRYVGGVRVINWPLSRLMLSKSASYYVRFITGLPFTDPTGGFKCFRRAVLETLDLARIRSNGYSFQIEMTHQAWMRGFHVVEVPITFEERRSGHSKMNKAIVREALWMVWKLLFRWKGRRTPPPGRNPRSVLASMEGSAS